MKKISVLGCGWLGLPLAKALLENGFSVNGSTTSEEKLPILENLGISPFWLNLSDTETRGDVSRFLGNATILIIDIPPKLRGSTDASSAARKSFVSKITHLIPFIEKSAVKKVLFISSTSVYGDTNSVVTEATLPNPETESGIQLLESERILKQNPFFETTVLRFGGLIGADRHPIRFLSGRKDIENPEAPINLIHQEDCIGIIQKIIEKNYWGETLNAVTPFHPSRKEYYVEKAIESNLVLPEFSKDKPSRGKTILSTKIIKELAYTFTIPQL